MRKFLDKSIVLATHNHGKIEEITRLFKEKKISIFTSKDFKLHEPKETGKTYVENGQIKARHSAIMTGLPCLADDSGIEVDALDGAPGVYTADWAETEKGRDFNYAMKKLWEKLEKINAPFPRIARFCCTLVLVWPDKHEEIFKGTVEGSLTWPPRGSNGHGFDPMFVPKNKNITYGEMNRWVKNSKSHRAVAFKKMIDECF